MDAEAVGQTASARFVVPRAAWVLAVAGALFLAEYTAVLIVRPSDGVLRFQSDFVYQVAPLLALALSFISIARSRGHIRAGWIAISIMLITWTAGDITFSYYDVRSQSEAPFPGFADVMYYAGYVAFAVAIALLTFPREKMRDRRWTIDALLIMVVAGSIGWVYILKPILDSDFSTRDAAVAMGYPLLDFVLLSMLVIALYSSGGRLRRRTALLMLATLFLIGADIGYTYLITTVGYDNVGNPLDPGYIASYWFIAICCLLPDEPVQEAAPNRQSLFGLMLPYAAVIPLGALIVAGEATGERPHLLVLALIAVIVLIVARQFITLRENLALYRDLERESGARRALLSRLVTAQEDLEEKVEEYHDAASRDHLTGLLNHRAFHEHLEQQLAIAERTRTVVSIAVLDVDDFKLVNDLYGHVAGDRLLAELAKALSAHVGDSGTLFRIGGDELAIVLPRVSGDDAFELMQTARDAISTATFGPDRRQTCSIGIASYPKDGATKETLLHSADAAMYEAKGHGKDSVVIADAPVRMG